ncbi:unnamed protein product [Schistocephalus solidus]|uniref:Secreted protein n=1 Tax=Schistocephalus solidus TaxID=70667 RepID=A0A183T561_SCHSO|nr:unnamed protein product [Schistocephalus solidus]
MIHVTHCVAWMLCSAVIFHWPVSQFKCIKVNREFGCESSRVEETVESRAKERWVSEGRDKEWWAVQSHDEEERAVEGPTAIEPSAY